MSAEATATHFIEIETERLILRDPRPSDAGAMATMANDEAVAMMTARLPHPYLLTDAHAFIEGQRSRNRAGQDLGLAITRKSDGVLLGCIGMRPHSDRVAELGYWLGRDHWGHGFATEAARAMVDRTFVASDAEAVIAACRVINEASRRVIEKCGLRYIGSGLDPAPARGGAMPVDRFRLSRRDWSSFKAWHPALIRNEKEESARCIEAH